MSFRNFQKKFWALPSLNKKVRISFEEKAKSALRQTLNEIINEIRNHPISKELMNQTSPSKFLPNYKGSGSLFAFMGFRKGETPVENLEVFIRTFSNYRISSNPIKILLGTRISLILPDKNEFRRSGFTLPWENGKSWPEQIEDGDISGLNFFLAKQTQNSRSGKGIQSKHELRSTSFQGTPYLSPIFENARKNFFNLLK